MRNLIQRIIIWYMKHTTPLFRQDDVVVGAFEANFYFEIIEAYEGVDESCRQRKKLKNDC